MRKASLGPSTLEVSAALRSCARALRGSLLGLRTDRNKLAQSPRTRSRLTALPVRLFATWHFGLRRYVMLQDS